MQFHTDKDKIVIIDFGSQVTKLIARRIRDIGVYSDIITPNEVSKLKNYKKIKGIILSGGPSTVTKKKFQSIPLKLLKQKIPILGICYGLQLIAKLFGGKIKPSNKRREFGRAFLIPKKDSLLTKNFFNNNQAVWMSHEDAVTKIPRNFKIIASTKESKLTIIENKKDKIFGVQFHPEVTHTDNGKQLFKNFVFHICKIKKNWSVVSQRKRLINDIKKVVKKDKVICALSGGVDSSVVALLINKAIKKNLICIMVDTGLMRKDEFKYTYRVFKKKYKLNVKLINASRIFLRNLKNISNPEKKRKIIGNLFIKTFEKESKKYKNIKYLAQGTLYPDIIESKSSTGSKTSKIKSHHNVGGLPKKMNLKLLEPLKEFFKDEVRVLGKSLGLINNINYKHPFPGPGLGIRIIGNITLEKIKILQKADHIYMRELIRNNLYNKIWQAYAALLPIKTVGVMGDSRTYENICLLRAVTSEDGMTADYYNFPKNFLDKISNKIINNVKGINRVVYDITSKPPSTIELE
jgi:GMP synthase (glutamine-hydrolysing)